jgi:hypothetical protein
MRTACQKVIHGSSERCDLGLIGAHVDAAREPSADRDALYLMGELLDGLQLAPL